MSGRVILIVPPCLSALLDRENVAHVPVIGVDLTIAKFVRASNEKMRSRMDALRAKLKGRKGSQFRLEWEVHKMREVEDLRDSPTRPHPIVHYAIMRRNFMHLKRRRAAYSSSDSAIGALEPGFMSFTPIPMSSTGADANFN